LEERKRNEISSNCTRDRSFVVVLPPITVNPWLSGSTSQMASTVSDFLVTDDLTILLGLIAATIFLLNNLYKPQPLVHPILLGRQSDVARVRHPGESAVYRNYGTGLMGRVRADAI
jgi:hypothetical protein